MILDKTALEIQTCDINVIPSAYNCLPIDACLVQFGPLEVHFLTLDDTSSSLICVHFRFFLGL